MNSSEDIPSLPSEPTTVGGWRMPTNQKLDDHGTSYDFYFRYDGLPVRPVLGFAE